MQALIAAQKTLIRRKKIFNNKSYRSFQALLFNVSRIVPVESLEHFPIFPQSTNNIQYYSQHWVLRLASVRGVEVAKHRIGR